MRGSVAKRLRRIVKHDKTAVGYVYRTIKKMVPVPKEISPSGFLPIDRSTRLLNGGCTRAKYQLAKKHYRRMPGMFSGAIWQVGI